MEDDGFQLVHRKRGNRRSKQTVILPKESACSETLSTNEDAPVDTESLKRRIQHCCNELMESQFYASLTKHIDQAVESARCGEDILTPSLACQSTLSLTHPTLGNSQCHKDDNRNESTPVSPDLSLVVYGLGNFVSCLIARYQLALVLALRKRLQVRPGGCETYDPKYTTAEKQIMVDLGFTVLDKNEEGKRGIQRATVVVMPHCGKALFNNLLWANWSPRQLQRLVVLGNSFSAMLESLPKRLWQKHIGFIAKISGHLREEPVENNFTHTDIFNDLSVHWFPAQSLTQLPTSVWSQVLEPVYDVSDVEIILQSQT